MPSTYSIFRRLDEPEIYCAVPQTLPLPRFVRGDAWEFDSVVDDGEFWERGFREGVAAWSGGRNGFYVFHDLPHRRAKSGGPAKGFAETRGGR